MEFESFILNHNPHPMRKTNMLLKNKHGLHFHEIPDSVVILSKAGVYKQTKAYIRGNALYAKHGSGFVQLTPNGTSQPGLNIDGIGIEGITVETGKTGRYEVKSLDGFELAKPTIEGSTTKRLEGPK